MSDLEDELLALAGGDVSSEDGEQMDGSRDASESPAPAAKKNETPAKGGAAKAPASKANKNSDDEEEEGEASSPPGSPDSQGSAAMDESDSDSDSPQTKSRPAEDDLNKYPVDGLFISHAEKSEIMSMREIEREQKIAERREEIERIRQNRMLRQLVVNQQDTKKRKAAAADLDDSAAGRKTSRARTKTAAAAQRDEPTSKIDSLRKAREERSNRIQQRELENDRRSKRRSPSYRRSASRDSADGSEVEWAEAGKRHRSRTPEQRETPEADLRDFERIRVGRSRFAEVCFYPGFEEAITGCYVRVNIGTDRDNPAAGDIYRMAVIKGFAKGKAYAMPNRQGKQIVVEAYVKAAHGKAQREWPFIACSDSAFTEAEFHRYKSVCAAEGVPIPKRPAFVRKIDDINGLVQRPWTEQELAEKLERQNSLKIKYSGAQRDRLQRAVADARARGDDARAAQLQDELDRLEVPRLAFRTSLTPVRAKGAGPSAGAGGGRGAGGAAAPASQQDRLALLNLENRRRNAEAVRQAQLKERARAREKALEEQRHLSQQSQSQQQGGDSEGSQSQSQRRLSASRSPGGGGGGRDPPSVPGSAAKGGAPPRPDEALMLKIKAMRREEDKGRRGVPTIHQPLMDDDIIGALDLGIDVDIEI